MLKNSPLKWFLFFLCPFQFTFASNGGDEDGYNYDDDDHNGGINNYDDDYDNVTMGCCVYVYRHPNL